MGKEPQDLPVLPADSVGHKAVEVGLLTAMQLREVLLDMEKTRWAPTEIGQKLVDKGYLTAAQLDALSGAPPKRVGKYVILRELGRGGMGVVYEAEDAELGRPVALKMLLGSLHANAEEAALEEERFVREARLSANLPKHPHIIGVYEAGLVDGHRFIAMEYIQGRQFSDWRRQGSITLRQQIALLRDVAMAVDHAHRHGIIHRDLKPDNILVDKKNHPHVADFGLAKRARQDATLSLTTSGMVMGTPAYMSPEQAQGGKDVDQRTDLWALGIMLYEILTGRVPFEADSPIKVLYKTVNDPVPPPSKILRGGPHAGLDQAIEEICMKALAKNPRLRYPTGRAFAEDLGRWLRGERISLGAPARKPFPKKSVLAGAGVLIAGIALAFFLLSPSAEERAQERAQEYVAQGQKLLKQGRYSDAIVKFGQALAEDATNRDGLAGKKAAEERLVAAARPAPKVPATDPTRERESVKTDLAGLDSTLSALRESESFGAARDLLTQSVRRHDSEDWTSAIATRTAALRSMVDDQYLKVRAAAVEAKRRKDSVEVDSARTRVSRWKWAGLSEELDLELARVKEAPPPPPPPPSVPGETLPPNGVRELAILHGCLNAVNSISFSGDGKLMASTDYDGALRLWDPIARVEIAKLPEKVKGRSVSISPDGKWIAVGTIDGILRIWDTARLEGRTLSVIDLQIMSVAFTPNSKSLVSSSLDGVVRLWDIETGLTVRKMEGHPGGALGLSLSPDARFVAVGTAEPLAKVWELSTGREVRRFENAGKKGVLCVTYAPDGRSVAFGGDSGDVMIGDPATGTFRVLGSCPMSIRGMAWSPDGRWIATASADNLLRLWEPATGKVTGMSLENGFYSVAFSPKGDLLAAGGADWSLRLWDLRGARK